MKISYELKGVDKLRMKLDFQKMIPDLLKAMDESTDIIKKETQKQIPYKSGKLSKSVETKKAHLEGKRIIGEVNVKKFYGKFLEHGTKKHLIKPKRKKAIKFDGIIVVSAMHPGIRARKFLEKALDSSSKKLTEIYSKAINNFWSR